MIKLRYDKFGVNWRDSDIAAAMAELDLRQSLSHFFAWTLEEKAQWSQAMYTLVAQQSDPDCCDIATRAFTQYRYGVPTGGAISQENALAAAKRGIVEKFGVTSEALEQYNSVYAYYDITDADNPVWRFHFSMDGRQALSASGSLYQMVNYRVEVFAETGELKSAGFYRLKDCTGYDAVLMWV